MRLRGFDRVHVPAGKSRDIEISVSEEDLKLWDMEEHPFVLYEGKYDFYIGASSADLRLNSSLRM